jgi:hypothetical protein
MNEYKEKAHTSFEEITTTGDQLLKRLQELAADGNTRRAIIRNGKGKTLLEVPLTVGVAGAGALSILAPFLSTIAFFSLLMTDCTIVVERYEDADKTREVEGEATVIDIIEEE